jgi:hypothetical protein
MAERERTCHQNDSCSEPPTSYNYQALIIERRRRYRHNRGNDKEKKDWNPYSQWENG